MKHTKYLWTLPSACKELGMSMRHVRRYIQALGIQPASPERRNGNAGGTTKLFILSRQDMQRLRDAIDGKICLS